MIGYLVNMHALRTPFHDDPDFRQVLRLVRQGLEELALHRQVPFPMVTQALGCELDPGHSPIVQVALNWRDRNEQMCFIGLDGLEVEPLRIDHGTSKFDLLLVIIDTGPDEEIWLEAEYRTDIFDEALIRRWVGHLLSILEAAATDASAVVSQLTAGIANTAHRGA